MLTQRSLKALLSAITTELKEGGFQPQKVVLFGSYANGNVHAYSDVDIALWCDRFSGDAMNDFELIRFITRKYPLVNFKLYPSYATAANFDPFIEIIEQTGTLIYEQEKQFG
jgi:predicted nucleotidyltransferase